MCVNASFSSQLKTWFHSNWSYSTAFYPGESKFSHIFAHRVKEATSLAPENGGKFQITSYTEGIGKAKLNMYVQLACKEVFLKRNKHFEKIKFTWLSYTLLFIRRKTCHCFTISSEVDHFKKHWRNFIANVVNSAESL